MAEKVEALFERAARGEIDLYTTSLVAAETLYVASRLYSAMKVPEPNERSLEYVMWLQHHVGLRVAKVDTALALEAGELRKQLGIALTDCTVIALAKRLGATPLFRKVESEMEPVVDRLRSLKVAFLESL